MDENNGASSSLPPFLTKTYEMVDDSSSDSIVSWSDNSKSFIVKNPAEFSRDLLPRFFKHKNFSSFIRQLNTYGFRKVDPEKWEFANDDFVRGLPHLMKNIHRRKPVHSHSLQNLQPLTESERRSMKDQIERLREEKQVLLADLQSQEQERKAFELQVTALKDRLQHMEQRQKSIASFVSQVLEKPGLSLNLETRERRKRRLQQDSCSSLPPPPSRSHAEQVEKLESSLTFWESLVTGVESSSVDLDVNETTSCAESLSIGDNRPKSTKIDMNSEPVATTTAAPKAGVNDVFWEQCLTENPGSIEQQEVQSERRDHGGGEIGDQRTYWWNSKNVNNIAEKT